MRGDSVWDSIGRGLGHFAVMVALILVGLVLAVPVAVALAAGERPVGPAVVVLWPLITFGWLAAAYVGAIVGSDHRGGAFAGLLFGLYLGWLGVAIVLVLPDRERRDDREDDQDDQEEDYNDEDDRLRRRLTRHNRHRV
jgi:hypothetical protein